MRQKKTTKQTAAEKALETLVSVKFYILVTATVFFWTGKLTEGTWQEMMLITAGLRTVNEVATIMQKKKAAGDSKS